jgi:plasmid stability protein
MSCTAFARFVPNVRIGSSPSALRATPSCLQDAVSDGILLIVAVQITIRDVPEAVRDELAARAARERKSMQEYLREELERLAARPSMHAWLEQVRERKRAAPRRIGRGKILAHRDADRR